MITQQHEHELQLKDQAPTPVMEHRWIVALLSFVGVVLPLVAGSMLWWPLGVPSIMDSQGDLGTIVLAAVVSVIAGAFLLSFAFRYWWVAVFAVLAWVVGEFLGLLGLTLVGGGWPEMQATLGEFWLDQIGIILLAVPPLFVCAVVAGLGAKIVLDKVAQRRASPQ